MQKEWRKTTKNLDWGLDQSDRERKCLKTFWKSVWTCENQVFQKTLYTIFDWSKTRFDWSKHTEPSQEFLIAISIDWKTNSIDRNTQSQAKNFNRNFDLSKNTFDWSKFWKNRVLKIKAKNCKNSSKHWILWIKCMSMRWNAFQKHLFWTQFSQN